jgi:transglutaminase-like putative cysteine protease
MRAPARPADADRPAYNPGPVEPTPGLPWAELAVALVATILALLPMRQFYGSLGWAPALAGAVLAGVVLGVLARRWPGWLVIVAAAAVIAVYAMYVCYPTKTFYGLPSLDSVRAVGTGLSSGWAKMLTVALPADVVGDLLATAVAVAFLAGLVVALMAVRTRWVTPLAVPPALLFLGGLLFTASRPGSFLLQTAVVLPGVLVLLLLRGNQIATAGQRSAAETAGADGAVASGLDRAARRWHSTLGRIAFGLPVVAVVGALGVVGANYLPIADGSHRADPRDLRQQEFRLSAMLTPLVNVKPQLEGSKQQLFTVTVTQRGGSVALDRLRVATLDQFDGSIWSQSRDFLITGSTLPQGPKLGANPPVDVHLDVHVDRLPQPFLPEVGRPVEVHGTDLAFDPANGALVSTRPSVSDYSYSLDGQVVPQANIAQAGVPSDMAQYTQLPDPPDWLTKLADDITKPYKTSYNQLVALETYLKGQGYSLDAAPGHNYGALRRVLEGAPDEQVGYAEQYASAFAVLARARGYATRVDVGYHLAAANRTGNTYKVYTSDAHAWPEVFLSGYGWVSFDPTNTGNPATSTPPRDSSAPIIPQKPSQQEKPAQPQQDDTAPAGTETGPGGLVSSRTAILVGAIAIGLPLLLIALVILLKANRRRRRRHRGGPADQVVAAWLEVVDRLRERGHPVADSTTPIEVAADARTGPAEAAHSAVWELASTATAAVCAPVPPDPQVADRAWELENEIRRAISAATPLVVRLRALVDPRPLLPRRMRRGRPTTKPTEAVSGPPAESIPQDATDGDLVTSG